MSMKLATITLAAVLAVMLTACDSALEVTETEQREFLELVAAPMIDSTDCEAELAWLIGAAAVDNEPATRDAMRDISPHLPESMLDFAAAAAPRVESVYQEHDPATAARLVWSETNVYCGATDGTVFGGSRS